MGFFSRLFVRTMNLAVQLKDIEPLVYWRDGMVVKVITPFSITQQLTLVERMEIAKPYWNITLRYSP